ncbi:MAG: hypothetical protein A3H31_07435 [Gallionellales bacterium RIFCSPLOWO2_02_FULL_57_47]|nr:MAG: hypothetical protein A3H31_07435 [Gallionellales bacterium RIFCSPLOWO2_02_FULL_57_47]OGT12795.1 MAG: hypothetical protein A3J49_09050 [Gallionellales bacterium RIFCSPHIGHO2_02_FULL_57_16]
MNIVIIDITIIKNRAMNCKAGCAIFLAFKAGMPVTGFALIIPRDKKKGLRQESWRLLRVAPAKAATRLKRLLIALLPEELRMGANLFS